MLQDNCELSTGGLGLASLGHFVYGPERFASPWGTSLALGTAGRRTLSIKALSAVKALHI
jgi:hypothetical protein